MFGWFKKDKIDIEVDDFAENFLKEMEEKQKQNNIKRLIEQKLRLLEIASNCSIPGESSSRTIERAVEFKKYIDEN